MRLLSARMDVTAAHVGRDIAASRKGARSDLNRLQRRIGESLASVKGRLEEISGSLERRPAVQEAPSASAVAPGGASYRGNPGAGDSGGRLKWRVCGSGARRAG